MPYKEYQKKWYEENKDRIREQRNEYNKQYRLKNKEKMKGQKNEYLKQYRIKNKEKISQFEKERRKTLKHKKSTRISVWKHRGVIFHDYDLLYDIYLQTTHCDECKCELNTNTYTRKCLDHDHDITDDENVRNILCMCCNTKRK